MSDDDLGLPPGQWVLRNGIQVFIPEAAARAPYQLETDTNPGYICGTPRAYRKHMRMRQIACEDCLAAIRIYQRMRRYGRTHRLILFAQCGTYSGYNSHRRKREDVCDDCRVAANDYFREYRAKRRAEAA